MRYEKFLLDQSEIPEPPVLIGEGLHITCNNRSELEQCESRNQNKLIEALYTMICELFEVDDMVLNTSTYSNSFFIIEKREGEIERGRESVELSRAKLKKATAYEIAGAIIDLVLHRNTWSKAVSYRPAWR